MGAGDLAGRIAVSTRSGRVVISAEDRTDVEVEGAVGRLDDSGAMVVKATSGSIVVRCPAGSDVVVGGSSSAVELVGSLGDVRVTTRSGRIIADEAVSIDARSVSGSVKVAMATRAVVRVTSGRVDLGLAPSGSGEVSAVSGSVRISVPEGVRPATTLRTVSGSVRSITNGTDGSIVVRTVSGSIDVTER